jgi:hypothetical protein
MVQALFSLVEGMAMLFAMPECAISRKSLNVMLQELILHNGFA